MDERPSSTKPDARRSGRSRRWLRWLAVGVAGLLLGAATTVGVAWRDAAEPPRLVLGLIDPEVSAIQTRDHLYIFAVDYQYIPREIVRKVWIGVSMRTSTSHPWEATPMDEYPERLREAIDAAFDKPPGWAVFPEPPEEPAIRRTTHTAAAGRPFLALRSYTTTTYENNQPARTESFGQIRVGNDRALPYLPIFPGFLFSSLLYAAPWWLLLLTPGVVKRWRRRRRGRCIECGYELAGLAVEDGARTCPECGAIDRVTAKA